MTQRSPDQDPVQTPPDDRPPVPDHDPQRDNDTLPGKPQPDPLHP